MFEQIVLSTGETFKDANIEIVLHDARDPLHSVVTISNPMTGRSKGSPATNLGIKLIEYYSETSVGNPPYISYKLPFRNKIFKASTIPLYDSKFGLFAFICINLDITNLVVNPNNNYIKYFVNKMAQIDTTKTVIEVLEYKP